MTFSPTTPILERILLYGGMGTGKSTAAYNIAEWMAHTGSPGRLFVIESDPMSWDPFLVENPTVSDGRIYREAVYGWDSWKPATAKFISAAGRDDWLVIDMIDSAWADAQSGFSEKAFGKTVDEWFMSAVGSSKGMGELSGDFGLNWGVINKMYGEWFGPMIRFPGHVLALAPEDEVRQPDRGGKGGDDELTRETFGRLGKKPAGQKRLGHSFHTVIRMQESPRGFVMTTARERIRSRERMNGKKVDKGFGVDYLMEVAKWTQ